MNHTKSVIDLLAGRKSTKDVAEAHDVDESVVLMWKALYLDGAAASADARAARKPSRIRWVSASFLAALLAIGSTASWVGYARSQAGCAQTLPSPLVTFCPGEPARASQVNGNFQQLVTWVQTKIGAVGTPGVATTTVTASSANVTDVNATRVNASSITPPYSGWGSQGVGAGGAAIYNDSGSFRALMLVGNNSNGGPRRVGLWDNVDVHGSLSVDNGLPISVSQAYGAESYTTANTTMTPVSRSMCFLVHTSFFMPSPTQSHPGCSVLSNGSNWYLRANNSGSGSAYATCYARCISW